MYPYGLSIKSRDADYQNLFASIFFMRKLCIYFSQNFFKMNISKFCNDYITNMLLHSEEFKMHKVL